MGFEPTTLGLRYRCSTTELGRHSLTREHTGQSKPAEYSAKILITKDENKAGWCRKTIDEAFVGSRIHSVDEHKGRFEWRQK